MIKKYFICVLVVLLMFCGCYQKNNSSKRFKSSELTPSVYQNASVDNSSQILSEQSYEQTLSADSSEVLYVDSSEIFSVDNIQYSSQTSQNQTSSAPIYTNEPTKIRVMTFNVMEEWISGKSVFGRIGGLEQIMNNVNPDIMVTQEADENWRLYIKMQKGITDKYNYRFYKDYGEKENLARIGIAYNKEKYMFLMDGFHYFDDYVGTEYEPTPPTYQGVYWNLLMDKVTGKKFIVMSTHWHHNSGKEYEWANTCRRYQAIEMTDLVNQLNSEYNCPVIVAGDFNSVSVADILSGEATSVQIERYSDNYCMKPFELDGGYTSAKYKEGVVVGEGAKSYKSTIDNIYVDKNLVSASFFDVYINTELSYVSDHKPIYADLIIK